MNCVSSPPLCSVSCVVSRTAPAPIIPTDYTCPSGTDCLGWYLFLVVLVFCWVRCERSEQPVGLVVESGCEVQRVRVSHIQRRGWEAQAPQSGDGERAAVGVLQLATELAGRRIVR